MEEYSERLSTIEQAITKLIVIQEGQAKQTEKLITSVDKFAIISVVVEQNAHDIAHLHESITDTINDIHVKETKIIQLVEENRRELDNIGQGRLWKGLTSAVAIIVFAFGYLYHDIHRISDEHMVTLQHQSRVIEFMKYTEKKLDEIIHLKKNNYEDR